MLDLLEVAYPAPADASSTAPRSTLVLSSISTDGKINLYDLAALSVLAGAEPGAEPVEIGPSGSHDTDGSRLTCVCAIGLALPGGAAANGEVEAEGESDGSSGEEGESDSEDEDEDEGEEEIAFEDEAEYE